MIKVESLRAWEGVEGERLKAWGRGLGFGSFG